MAIRDSPFAKWLSNAQLIPKSDHEIQDENGLQLGDTNKCVFGCSIDSSNPAEWGPCCATDHLLQQPENPEIGRLYSICASHFDERCAWTCCACSHLMDDAVFFFSWHLQCSVRLYHVGCAQFCANCLCVLDSFCSHGNARNVVTELGEHKFPRSLFADLPALAQMQQLKGMDAATRFSVCIQCMDHAEKCPNCDRIWLSTENKRIIRDAHQCMACVESAHRREERARTNNEIADNINARAAAAASVGQMTRGESVTPKRPWQEWLGREIIRRVGSRGETLFPDSDSDTPNDGDIAAETQQYPRAFENK